MLVGMEMWIYTWIQTVTFFLYSASCLKINIVILHLYFLSLLCLSVGLFLLNTLLVCWFISYQYFACLLVYFLSILCLSVLFACIQKTSKGQNRYVQNLFKEPHMTRGRFIFCYLGYRCKTCLFDKPMKYAACWFL